jgi:hypothetical protein
VRLLLAEHPALRKAAWDMRSADNANQRVMSAYVTEQPSALPHYLLWVNGVAWPWVPVYSLWHHSQLTLVHLAASSLLRVQTLGLMHCMLHGKQAYMRLRAGTGGAA